MKTFAFWDETLYDALKVTRMFGETSLEQFQGRGMNQARNQRQNMWS
jgi:hypothetical protein